jgi:hypothetical protein
MLIGRKWVKAVYKLFYVVQISLTLYIVFNSIAYIVSMDAKFVLFTVRFTLSKLPLNGN